MGPPRVVLSAVREPGEGELGSSGHFSKPRLVVEDERIGVDCISGEQPNARGNQSPRKPQLTQAAPGAAPASPEAAAARRRQLELRVRQTQANRRAVCALEEARRGNVWQRAQQLLDPGEGPLFKIPLEYREVPSSSRRPPRQRPPEEKDPAASLPAAEGLPATHLLSPGAPKDPAPASAPAGPGGPTEEDPSPFSAAAAAGPGGGAEEEAGVGGEEEAPFTPRVHVLEYRLHESPALAAYRFLAEWLEWGGRPTGPGSKFEGYVDCLRREIELRLQDLVLEAERKKAAAAAAARGGEEGRGGGASSRCGGGGVRSKESSDYFYYSSPNHDDMMSEQQLVVNAPIS